jgi:hypothetical protein
MSGRTAAAQAIRDAIEDLFTFFQRKVEPSVAQPYIRVLEKYSPAVIRSAIDRAKDSRTFFPKPVELRADAEACRQALQMVQPHQPCDACRAAGTPGWRQTTDTAGIVRLARCQCWRAYGATMSPASVVPSKARQNPKFTDSRELGRDVARRLRVVGGQV